jgi:hypothetical protein
MELDLSQPIKEEHEQSQDQVLQETQEQTTEETQDTSSTEENTDFFAGVGSDSEFSSIDEEIEHLKNTKVEGDDFTQNKDFSQGADEFTEGFDDKKTTKKNSKKNASMFTRWFDTAFSFLLSFFAGDDDFTKFKAEPKNLKVIEESLEDGFGSMDRDIQVPWYLGLFIEIPIAYSPKIQMAFRLRKMNRQAKKQKTSQAKHHRTEPSYGPAKKKDSKEHQDIEEVEIIGETPTVKKEKQTKPCLVCGKQHKNKETCSGECRVIYLNRKKKNKHG